VVRILIIFLSVFFIFSNALFAACSDYLSKSFSSPFHLIDGFKSENTVGIKVGGLWPLTRSRTRHAKYFDSEERKKFELTYQLGSYYLDGRPFLDLEKFFVSRSFIYGVDPENAKIYLPAYAHCYPMVFVR